MIIHYDKCYFNNCLEFVHSTLYMFEKVLCTARVTGKLLPFSWFIWVIHIEFLQYDIESMIAIAGRMDNAGTSIAR